MKKGKTMLNDLEEILLSRQHIQNRIQELGRHISEEYQGKDLFVMSVLKGSVVFLADLVRAIDIPLEYGFVTISTYKGGIRSQEKPSVVNTTFPSLEGKDVLLVEDILDTGATIEFAVDWIRSLGVNSIKVCVLVAKEGYENSAYPNPDYIGFPIPNRFVVGYGLDYEEKYRNLAMIGILKESIYTTAPAQENPSEK
jgi:hypoxanthine phosphoribosyltransferase